MDRRGWLWLLGIALAIGGAWMAWSAWSANEERARIEDEAAESEQRQRRSDERVGRLREESARLMPSVIEGVALGMTLDEVRALRGTGIMPSTTARDHVLSIYEELLPNGGQVIFGFTREGQRLVQVQLLSLLPSRDAIAPHLVAMNEQYGRPTGVWDCPITGDVPTRRFTWRGAHATVSDVFLVYGDRVSLTLYIATSEQIGRSLAMARCTPVTPADIDRFPVATPEQIQGAQQQ